MNLKRRRFYILMKNSLNDLMFFNRLNYLNKMLYLNRISQKKKNISGADYINCISAHLLAILICEAQMLFFKVNYRMQSEMVAKKRIRFILLQPYLS